MINELISLIIQNLYATFGDSYKYYTENIEQGAKSPCFFVKVVDYNYTREVYSNRSKREKDTITIGVILYLNEEDEDINSKINELSKEVIYALEFMKVNNTIVMFVSAFSLPAVRWVA